MSGPAQGLYGYSLGLASMQGFDAATRAARLADLGATVLFGGDDDPAFVEQLYARGIQVMAEFACFVGDAWWQRFPDARPVLANGDWMPQEGSYCGVNPAHETVRAALLERLRGLVATRPLDGLWLDFCRWPCHWEAPMPLLPATSFDAATVAAFGRDAGLADLGQGKAAARRLLGDLRAAWLAWRSSVVTAFAAEAAAIVRAAQPRCLVGLFTVPWRRKDRDGALEHVIGQDLAALAEHIDVFSPMVYHRMCGQPPEWIATVCNDVRAATARAVWPIVQAVDEPAGMAPDEYRAALEQALAAGDGVLVFNLQGLEDAHRWQITRESFTRRRS